MSIAWCLVGVNSKHRVQSKWKCESRESCVCIVGFWHIPLSWEGKRLLFALHVVLLSQLNISWLSVLICWRLERNISKRDLCIHSFGTWFRKYFWFLARDWCVLQNKKCVKVMFVWSVFKELFNFFFYYMERFTIFLMNN